MDVGMKNISNATSEATVHSPEASPEAGCTWSRLPKPGEVEPRSGLNRHAINKLILGEHPVVISKALKSQADAKRCIRLVKITGSGSLLEYLNKVEA
ncbi:hypothetical protein EBX31_10450 [bacterium]|nr:hypothetical protein [bacterium]